MSTVDRADPLRRHGSEVSGTRRIDMVTLIAFVVITAVVASAVLGDSLARYGPTSTETAGRLLAPSTDHLLGTDNFGRDVLDRIVTGARGSLIIGLAVGAVTTIVGGLLGVVVAVWRSVDDLVMRVLDGLMAFPPIFLAIALVAVAGGGMWQVIVALSIVYFPRTARVTRGVALTIVGRSFVETARVLGARRSWIIWHHIVPMAYGAVLVLATYVMARAIVVDASLSFLGLGIPPPEPTWGNMLGEARPYISQSWWMATFPGIAIILTTISVNLIGDYLRDRLDSPDP